MNSKKDIIICGLLALTPYLLISDVQAAGRLGGQGFRGTVGFKRPLGMRKVFSGHQDGVDAAITIEQGRIRRNPKSYDHRQAQSQRISRERESMVRARMKSADTRPSDDIARIGRSHSTTRQVDFRAKDDSRDSERFTSRKRFRQRSFMRHPSRRLRPILPARRRWVFTDTPRMRMSLRFRHNRFHSRGWAHRYHHFYYYSLPCFTYYYCISPYYYSVPCGFYPNYERYFAEPETGAEVPEEGTGETEERAVKKLREPAEDSGQDKELMAVNRHLSDIASAFAAGDFEKCVELSSRAVDEFPDNPVLLFVYCQSLFASGNYQDSADILMQAVDKVDLEKQGIFYTLGFYPDEDVLTGQIDELTRIMKKEPENPALQLLLGYQLMGIGDFQQARELLVAARQSAVLGTPYGGRLTADAKFADAAGVLLDILEASEKNDSEEQSLRNEQSDEPVDY